MTKCEAREETKRETIKLLKSLLKEIEEGITTPLETEVENDSYIKFPTYDKDKDEFIGNTGLKPFFTVKLNLVKPSRKEDDGGQKESD